MNDRNIPSKKSGEFCKTRIVLTPEADERFAKRAAELSVSKATLARIWVMERLNRTTPKEPTK